MQELIIDIMNQFGYLGIFLLIAIENIFPPIPSEIILTFGGFMTTYTAMNVWIVILAATAGSVVGAVVLYTVGRWLNADRLTRLVDSKLGRVLHLRKQDVKRAEKWFIRRGNKAVFFCRFVPIVRSLISIPAGMAKMKFSSFLALTLIGTSIWNVVLVYLGRFAGNAWVSIAHYFDIYSTIALVALLAIMITIGAIFIKKRFLNKSNNVPTNTDKSDVE